MIFLDANESHEIALNKPSAALMIKHQRKSQLCSMRQPTVPSPKSLRK
jgi:hypothetical protein